MDTLKPPEGASPEREQSVPRFTAQEKKFLTDFARNQGLLVNEDALDDLETLNLCEDLLLYSMPNFIIGNTLESILRKAQGMKNDILERLRGSPLADPEILPEDNFGSYYGKCEQERRKYHASIRMRAAYLEMRSIYENERVRELNPDENEDHLSLWHCEKLLALKKFTAWLSAREGEDAVRRRYAHGDERQHAVNRLLTSLAENEMTLRRRKVIGSYDEEDIGRILLNICRAVGNTAEA